MTKPLLIVCVLLSLGAAVLGYFNFQKLQDTRNTYEQEFNAHKLTKGKLDEANKDIEQKKQEITGLNSKVDELSSSLRTKEQELTKSKEDLATAQGQIESLTKDIETTKTDLKAAQDEIARVQKELDDAKAGATVAGGQNPPETSEQDRRIKELEQVNQTLQDRNSTLEARANELQRKETDRQHAQMRQGLQGTVLAVNSAWNFVVLNMGDRQGVVPNAEMLVKRGDQFLGRIRVTSVEPSTSVADILVRTVPRGFSVMPGDSVIYQSDRN